MRADEKYATYDACAYIVLPVIFRSEVPGYILYLRYDRSYLVYVFGATFSAFMLGDNYDLDICGNLM